MSFRRTWQQFRRAGRALVPTPGVREAWHQGRRWYHVWVLLLDDPGILARRDAVSAAMGDAVIPFCDGEPHVTVWVHGFGDPPSHPDEGAVIPVRVGRANAFRSCPILEVRADIAPLRGRFPGTEERWQPYLPHLTVARFIRPLPTDVLATRLRPFRRAPPLVVPGHFVHRVLDAWDERGSLHRP